MPGRQVYPYSLAADALAISIHDPEDPTNEELDLSWLESDASDDTARRMDLRGNGQWRQLSFRADVRIDPSRLVTLLPSDTDYRKETEMILSVRCPTTKLRYPLRATPSAEEDGLWSTDVVFNLRDVRSRVEFHALLYRGTSIPSGSGVAEGLARERFSLLAYGRPLIVSIDDVNRHFRGAVTIKWDDFGTSKNSWRLAHPTSIYFLEPDPDEPVLWLNTRYPKLKALLFDRSEQGPDASMRNLLSGWLAEIVWIQLFHVAVGSVSIAGAEETGQLPEGWRGDVLRKFLPAMFPDDEEIDAALSRAIQMRDTPDEVGVLVSYAATVAQDIVKSHNVLARAVRAIERDVASPIEEAV